MNGPPLKTAVLGLNNTGKMLLEAALQTECLNVTAVADSDTNLAQQIGTSYGCAFYDDYRQLIIQNQLDCLLVAAPTYTCAEYIITALKKKFNIFKIPPLARNFGESAEFAKLAQTEGVKFVVANLDRLAQSALAMRTHILNKQAERVFFILAAAGSPASDSPQANWRNDPILAGGGTILHDCWDTIDLITSNFGIPQQVYCVAGSTAPDRQQRLYLTEDTAVITMKFSDTLSGTLLAGRAAENSGKQPQKYLIAHSQDTLLKCDDNHFEVTGAKGRTRRKRFDDDYPGRMKKALENFAAGLLSPDKNILISTVGENLKNMAVIEAAYLSARTGMPEEPARILKIA